MRDTVRCRRVLPLISGLGRCFDCRAKNKYSCKQMRDFVNVVDITWGGGGKGGGGLKRPPPPNIFSTKEYSTELKEGQIEKSKYF